MRIDTTDTRDGKKKRKIKKMKEVTTHRPEWGGIKMGLHIINNILFSPSSSSSSS